MKKMTEENLRAAFAGESQAHMKYLIFADEAEKRGRTNTARLFRAVAFAEKVHATNHLKALGALGDGPGNLGVAIDGETFEVEEMYPTYAATAEMQQEKAALRSMNWALEAEKVHAEMYGEAKKAEEGGSDVELGVVQVCDLCGWTVEGDAPEKCPLCGARKERFKAFG